MAITVSAEGHRPLQLLPDFLPLGPEAPGHRLAKPRGAGRLRGRHRDALVPRRVRPGELNRENGGLEVDLVGFHGIL
jgi:hypothetical protein